MPGNGTGAFSNWTGLGLGWRFIGFLVFCVGRPVRADGKARNVDGDRVGFIC